MLGSVVFKQSALVKNSLPPLFVCHCCNVFSLAQGDTVKPALETEATAVKQPAEAMPYPLAVLALAASINGGEGGGDGGGGGGGDGDGDGDGTNGDMHAGRT